MSALSYRPDIQGLRAVAVLVVMIFHFNPVWLPGGFIGVDVFLVISGFLIVSILLHKKADASYLLGRTLRYFYTSRFKRIAPAYFAMLVLVSIASAILFLPQDLAIYQKSLSNAFWFNSNNYFANFGDYFAPANHEQPLLHTWSLAVELQFYLIAPFLVLLLPVKALKWVFTILLLGLTTVAQYRMQGLGIQQATYYSLYARLPEFFAGGLVALHILTAKGGDSKPWLGNTGLVLVLSAAIAQPMLGAFPGLPALVPAAGAALILLCPAPSLAQRILANKPMVWLGELSYSLYLWHWPVLALLRYYTGSQILDIPLSLIFLALTLLLATLSFYWVETPLRAQHSRAKQTIAYGLLIGIILTTSFGLTKINQAFSPPRLPIEYQRYADPKTICHGQIIGDCLKGDLSSKTEVLVLGDSHAAMLNLFFDQLGKDLGFKVRIITASSCVTIPEFDYQHLPEWAQHPCENQIKAAQNYIERANIVFIAGMWSYQFKEKKFAAAITQFIISNHAKTYWLSQVPEMETNPVRCVRLNALRLSCTNHQNKEYNKTNQILAHLIEKHDNAKYLEMSNLEVFKNAPVYQNEIIYSDKSHLNEVGSRFYASEAKIVIQEIIPRKNGGWHE